MAKVVRGIGAERPEDPEPLSASPVPQNPKPPVSSRPPVVTTLADYIQLDTISCVDAHGTVFEHYDKIYVRKDIERHADKRPKNFTPYADAVYFEQQGLFLPSFALSCNILAALYQHKSDPAVQSVLMQYKDKGNGQGWHAQNTLIDFEHERILHYPTKDDFAQLANVNSSRPRATLPFFKATLHNSLLDETLGHPAFARYVKQLTGLQNPSVLLDIGKYFEKPVHLWFPGGSQANTAFTEKRAAWLGCSRVSFSLDSDHYLNYTGAARGVRLEAP